MHVNPQRISVRQRKVIQRVQTNTRWVFQHWGAEPAVISYNGLTGYMNPKVAQEYSQRYIDDQLSDFRVGEAGEKALSPYQTAAYQALLKLRTFYEEPHRSLQGDDLTKITGTRTDEKLQKLRLNFYYRDTMYVGYFTRMEIREEETSPWMWSYSMEFTAFDMQANVYAGVLHRWEADELKKAAVEKGYAVDEQLARAAIQAKGAPGIRGAKTPAQLRYGPAAATTQGYKKESMSISTELESNLVQRNLITTESTDA